ncbi:hypothetical protein KR026_002994 [Drosophila bipectinata]|nr:hypothetical protein KR026_002994 [Drosophila bipectinata]
MNRKPRKIGPPVWMPLFILFLLFMASVWVMVNRQGLLDMYHTQVHGRGDLVCSKGGSKSRCSRGGKRDDLEMNPFKAFLEWPGKSQVSNDNLGSLDDIKLDFEEDFPRSRPRERNLFDDDLIMDHKLESFGKRQDMGLGRSPQRVKNQARYTGMQRKQNGGHRRRLVNSPVMDFRREFASDEANPYVENLQQRYNPSPYD